MSAHIILSAGIPHRGDRPSLLTQVNGVSLLEWYAANFKIAKPQVVVGYNADFFQGYASQVSLVMHTNWENTKSVSSLLCADLSASEVLVSYADILYRPTIIKELQGSSAVVTLIYDSYWRTRYAGRTEKDMERAEKVILKNNRLLRSGSAIDAEWATGEFIGLVHFKGVALDFLRDLQANPIANIHALNMSDLLEYMRLQGFDIEAIDVKGDWAELNEPQDIAHFILGTKAETLARLSSMVQQSVVLEQVSFTVEQWQQGTHSQSIIIHQIQDTFKTRSIVVRSSAKSEDAFTQSNAGAYTSVLNINIAQQELVEAIETVIASYLDCQPDDQVLVQPMLQDVAMSGVAFTRTLEHSAPFYRVNYDESGDTESITSGQAKEHKTLYFLKGSDIEQVPSVALKKLITALQEVEQILRYDALDIEFAIDTKDTVYLLQARPIVAQTKQNIDAEAVLAAQRQAAQQWQELQEAAPHLQGDSGLFGLMPDWNPAEIVGTNPGKLAFSLYGHLILSDIWATQRAEYGYKDVRPQKLLYSFAGKPYINIRASFNSFVPADLNTELTQKLVNFYLSYLQKHPYLHDKVEFDVVPTCFGPGFSKWEQRLLQEAGLTGHEVAQLKLGLQNITQQALFRQENVLKQVDKLQQRHRHIVEKTKLSDAEKLVQLIENTKRYGTLPFAHLARSGFIAVTLLREGVEQGILSVKARDGFMQSLQTVSQELSLDAWQVSNGKVENKEPAWLAFVEKYGHLRPGTYDITSPAYKDDIENFLRPIVEQAKAPRLDNELIHYWHQEKVSFFEELRNIGLQATDTEFEAFLKLAIEGREEAKFIFTKSLSYALSLIEKIGKTFDLSVHELANIDYFTLIQAFESDSLNEQSIKVLKAVAKQNSADKQLSLACQLPPLLTSKQDFEVFLLTEDKPNFIGAERVSAPVTRLLGGNEQHIDVTGCIVFIPQADPGYDWLFGKQIAGLVTMYGGANSHMAIRSAEFGLPAAIGVGEQIFNKYKDAQVLELDPAGETIRVVR